jgi:hypothetical protein
MTYWDLLIYFDLFAIWCAVGALILKIWSRKKQGRRLAQQEESMHPFVVGDMVILGENNPYKGCLRCGIPYEVLITTSHHIVLLGDNGTEGCFTAGHFQLYTGIGRPMPGDGHREYEEAIAAQEAMDNVRR